MYRPRSSASVRHGSGLVTPIELVEPTRIRAGIDRRRRSALAELFQLRFQVGLEAGPVFALERAQLLEPAFQHRALLVDGAHDPGMLALGVGLQRVGLFLSLAQLALGAALRVS